MSNILILGAGFVAGPAVEYLHRSASNRITLGSHIVSEAESIAKHFDRVNPIKVDVTDDTQMQSLVSDHDLVISLVPYVFHVPIAKICIALSTPMITASYVSDDMRALDKSAKEAGVFILNEIGLDPGIDHLSAMKIIDDAHAKGGQVLQFSSWCGGLPAPECNDNPLGYKFAWAPKAVLLALLNEAKFLKHANDKVIPASELLNSTQPMTINDFELEGYPNRDSTGYRESYGIPEVQDLIRGTLRYRGFADIFSAARCCGLLDPNQPVAEKQTWKEYINQQISEQSITLTSNAREAFEWLGLLSDDLIKSAPSMLDAFCAVLQSKLNYRKNEYDMIVLQHKFTVAYEEGNEHLSSTLVVKGEANGFSAMAKTVGYPVAIATQLILDNKINEVGVQIPVKKSIYEPILEQLENESIVCIEKHEPSLVEPFFNE